MNLVRRLAITNTTLPMLIKIADTFGGRIHTHTPPGPRRKQQFQWYVYGEAARYILHGVLPYLVVKREEAELYLAFEGRFSNDTRERLFPWQKRERESLYLQVQQLRKRAWSLEDVPPQHRPQPRSVLPIN